MKACLVLVDLQRDYLSRPGLQPTSRQLIRGVTELLATCRSAGLPVLHLWTTIQREPDRRMPHWREAGRWDCLEGTEGHAVPRPLEPEEGETVIHKQGFSGLRHPDVDAFLSAHGIDTAVVAGLHLHACVRQAVLDLHERGLNVRVAEDACSSDDPLHAEATRRWLEARRILFVPTRCALDTALDVEPPFAVARQAIEARLTDTASEAPVRPTRLPNASTAEWPNALATRLSEKSEELAQAITAELGKPIRFSRLEVQRSAEMVEAIARRLARSPLLESEVAAGVDLRRRAHGLVAAITPANNPLYLPLGKLVPALLLGNSVAWKPAHQATKTSRALFAILHESLPDSATAIALIEGGIPEARALMEHPSVRAITLTGSEAAGRTASEVCARRHLPLQAELGGNNAAVVWDDADLTAAAKCLVSGAFDLAGQRCTATRRVIVREERYEGLVAKLEAAAAALTWGDPRDEATTIGPLHDRLHTEHLIATLDDAKARGLEVRRPLGTELPSAARDYPDRWMAPAIVRCQDPEDELVQEESFGPVLVIQTVRNWEEAMSRCNGVRQGLVAAVFTPSEEIIDRFLAQAEAGMLKVNRSTADAAVDAPFGGWKASGLGPPEHGDFDLEFFTRAQMIYP